MPRTRRRLRPPRVAGSDAGATGSGGFALGSGTRATSCSCEQGEQVDIEEHGSSRIPAGTVIALAVLGGVIAGIWEWLGLGEAWGESSVVSLLFGVAAPPLCGIAAASLHEAGCRRKLAAVWGTVVGAAATAGSAWVSWTMGLSGNPHCSGWCGSVTMLAASSAVLSGGVALVAVLLIWLFPRLLA